jgi:hypothetical protein
MRVPRPINGGSGTTLCFGSRRSVPQNRPVPWNCCSVSRNTSTEHQLEPSVCIIKEQFASGRAMEQAPAVEPAGHALHPAHSRSQTRRRVASSPALATVCVYCCFSCACSRRLLSPPALAACSRRLLSPPALAACSRHHQPSKMSSAGSQYA